MPYDVGIFSIRGRKSELNIKINEKIDNLMNSVELLLLYKFKNNIKNYRIFKPRVT